MSIHSNQQDNKIENTEKCNFLPIINKTISDTSIDSVIIINDSDSIKSLYNYLNSKFMLHNQNYEFFIFFSLKRLCN